MVSLFCAYILGEAEGRVHGASSAPQRTINPRRACVSAGPETICPGLICGKAEMQSGVEPPPIEDIERRVPWSIPQKRQAAYRLDPAVSLLTLK